MEERYLALFYLTSYVIIFLFFYYYYKICGTYLYRLQIKWGVKIFWSAFSPRIRMKQRKRNPVPHGYNLVILSLREINTGTWPSRLGGFSEIWSIKYSLGTALARASSNREGAINNKLAAF
jgi:hypothetical protein